MKARVSNQGLLIPKELLEGSDEVEICKEGNQIMVMLQSQPDPIFGLGRQPVPCEAPDASEQHDKYLYGSAQ
jgi:hypothetical protein